MMHALRIGSMTLLLGLAPFTPWVLGLPRHRILEMFAFWVLQWGLLFGIERTIRSPGREARVLACLGAGLAYVCCLLSLTNLSYCSIWGAGFRSPGLSWMELFPKELGYAMALLLLVALLMQIPAVFVPAPVDPQARRRPAQLVMRILLGLLFLFFFATLPLVAVDRRLALLAVLVTWPSSILFLIAAIEQLLFASRLDWPLAPRA